MVLGHRHGQRRALVLPVGDQLVERDRVDHRARQDVRADLAALFEDADAKARGRPRSASCFRRIAALSPAGPGADDHHVILHGFAFAHPLSRSRSRLVASRRMSHIRLICPANSLTAASMAGRNGAVGGERGIDRHCRGAQRIGLVARGRRRRRDPGRAARLAEAAAPRAEASAPTPRRRPTSSSRATKRSPSCRTGSRAARSCRSPRRPRKRILPHGPGKCRDHAAQRCAGARGFRRRPADRRRSLGAGAADAGRDRHRAGPGLQRLAVLLPRARRADERRGARGLRRDRPAAHPARQAASGCCCSATGPRRRCSASRDRRRAAMSTRSRACAPSPPSTRAT